jgi:hypothetical protein
MTIVIYACITSQLWCSSYYITAPADRITPYACMAAQSHVAQWALKYPKWRVNRYSCKPLEFARAGQ